MKKSVVKRIRITRTGKIVRRRMSVNHFRTRRSQKNIRKNRKMTSLDHPKKSFMKLLY
ncbi:hypothetical protein C4587_01445 [Candidatus Parcubacteria bacterium]|nr:MAG: hypothetical protein C4587_01445 [Candidatus Parcubacteria bacterium]